MNNSNKKQVICTCFHCGNKGQLDVVGEYTYSFDNNDDDIHGRYKWEMLFCPVCNMITLHQTYNENEVIDENDQYFEEESVLYPENEFNLNGVPTLIKTKFESAIKIKNIDTMICVLALRTVLEEICKEKKAKGGNLSEMIKNLVDSNILPNGFDDACEIIRLLGNSAAHSEPVFYTQEVETLISLLKAIIDYLYIIPMKIGDLQKRIEVKGEGEK